MATSKPTIPEISKADPGAKRAAAAANPASAEWQAAVLLHQARIRYALTHHPPFTDRAALTEYFKELTGLGLSTPDFETTLALGEKHLGATPAQRG